jgi:hypothetical protein
MREIRGLGFGGKLNYDAENFKLDVGDGNHNALYLNNAYQEYLNAARAARAEVLRKFASLPLLSLEDREPPLDEAKANLLPRVQSRAYHEQIRLRFSLRPGMAKTAFIHRPFAKDLVLDVVYDHPEMIQSVSARSLEEWGITFEQALAIAKENLWRRSNEPWEEVAPGVHLSPWRDTHDAGRLYLHDLIWQLPVKGDHVAIAPNRVMVLVSGADDERGLVALAELAEKAQEVDRIVSGTPIRLTGNTWAAWLPPAGHPAHASLKRLGMSTLAGEYADQTQLLNAIHQKTDQDIFVANHTLMGRKDGEWFSWTSWTSGVTDILMPWAQWVCLGQYQEPPQKTRVLGWAKFERAREAAGELFEPTDHYPPRYRVRSFPTDEQLLAMELGDSPE